jgi:hypothetical protein
MRRRMATPRVPALGRGLLLGRLLAGRGAAWDVWGPAWRLGAPGVQGGACRAGAGSAAASETASVSTVSHGHGLLGA